MQVRFYHSYLQLIIQEYSFSNLKNCEQPKSFFLNTIVVPFPQLRALSLKITFI